MNKTRVLSVSIVLTLIMLMIFSGLFTASVLTLIHSGSLEITKEFDVGGVEGTVNFPDSITVMVTGISEDWASVPDTTNLYVQDYSSAPGGNPKVGRFDYKRTESGSEASIIVQLNNYYGIHLNVY